MGTFYWKKKEKKRTMFDVPSCFFSNDLNKLQSTLPYEHYTCIVRQVSINRKEMTVASVLERTWENGDWSKMKNTAD